MAKGTKPAAIRDDHAISKHYGGYKAAALQSSTDVLEKLFPYITLPPTPTVTQFYPLHVSPGFDDRVDTEPVTAPHGKLPGGLCQLVGAPSAAVLTRDVPSAESWVRSDKKPTATLFMTSKGVRDSKSSMNAELVASVVKFEHVDVACRASILGATSANFAREIFFFDLTPSPRGAAQLASAAPSTAITYELDLNKGSKVTACAVADIAILLLVPPEKPPKGLAGPVPSVPPPSSSSSAAAAGKDKDAFPQPPTVIGQHALMLVGDTDGRVHYCIAAKAQPSAGTPLTVLQAGSWGAHKAPVVALATRADAVRPLWRIAVAADHGQPYPTAAPGSAVITLAKNGEVNVWQPSFATSSNVRSKPDLVLAVFTPKFHLAGTFLMRTVSDVPVVAVEAAPASDGEKLASARERRKSERRQSKRDRKQSSKSALATEATEEKKGGEEAQMKAADAGVAVAVPEALALAHRAPTSMSVDPSCQHLIAAFDDGSVDVWPLPGLHKGVDSSSIQTCRERLWTSMEHDDAITSARVWTNYEEPFLYQVGGLAAAAAGGASTALTSSSSSSSGSTSSGSGQPTGVMAVGTGGFTADILKKLAAASTLTTSSEDRSVILWLFAPAMSNAGAGGGAGPGVTRFLQPTPARRFHFSSVPTRALCFHSSASDNRKLSLLTMTNSMLQELAEATWQVSVVVDGRVITAVKAQKQLLLRPTMPPSRVKAATTLARVKMGFLRDDESVSSHGSSLGGGLGGPGGPGGSVELHGSGAQLSFIPVVSPVLSASHASEVMARRAVNFVEGSLTLLDAWAAPKVTDSGRAGILGGGKPLTFVSEKWMSIGNSGTSQRPRSPGQPDVIMVRVRDHTTLLDLSAAETGGPVSLRAQKKTESDAARAVSEHPPLVDRRAHVILDGLRLRVPSPVAGFGDASLGLANAFNIDYSLEYGGFASSSDMYLASAAHGAPEAPLAPGVGLGFALEHGSSISIPTASVKDRVGPPSASPTDSPTPALRQDNHEGSEEGSLATALTGRTAQSPTARGRVGAPAGPGVAAEPSLDLSVSSPHDTASPLAAHTRAPAQRKASVRLAPPAAPDKHPYDASIAAGFGLPVTDSEAYHAPTILRPGSSPTAPLSRERVRGKFAVGRGLEGGPAGSSHAVINNASIGFDQVRVFRRPGYATARPCRLISRHANPPSPPLRWRFRSTKAALLSTTLSGR